MNTASRQSADVVVVGGGIVGTSAAAFLAGAGLKIVLVEREGLASGASGANSGIVQHPFDPVMAVLYRETVALYRELSAVSAGFRLPSSPAGMLFVTEQESAARSQAATISNAFAELHTDVLGGIELQQVEGAVAADLWACRADIGYPVMPGASTYAYATLAEGRGAEIRQGHEATLELEHDTVVGVRVNGRLIAAGAVLVAAGPWTPAVIDPIGRWAPFRPLWGAVVEVELAHPPRHLLEQAGIEAVIGGAAPGEHELDFSLVPLPGVSVVGSTFLAREPDPRDWIEPILQQATRFVPAVADAPIRGARACARPQSADGRPLIGAIPWHDGLYVCAGHGPWGISTGPGSARLVTDAILGRKPEIAPELNPGRFGVATPLG
jgi:glycine/D-amino acid oxidase-like deaminating enzyme